MMMTYEGPKSAWDHFGKFIYQFQPETKTLIRKLERILNNLYRQNLSLLFNEIYIYIFQKMNVNEKSLPVKVLNITTAELVYDPEDIKLGKVEVHSFLWYAQSSDNHFHFDA